MKPESNFTPEKEQYKRTSVKEAFNNFREKVLDSLYSVAHGKDEELEEYQKGVNYSFDLSEQAAEFNQILVEYSLHEPEKQYKHKSRKTHLDFISNKLKDIRSRRRNSSPAEQDEFKAKFNIHFAEMAAEVDERSRQGRQLQIYHQAVKQEGGNNIIEEIVRNDVYPEGGSAIYTDLLVHEPKTKKTVDLNRLLPKSYAFFPSQIIDWEDEILDLNKYGGTQTGGPYDFAAETANVVPDEGFVKKVRYGNIKKKGGTLSLLHEIAHAWQAEYYHDFGKYPFMEWYSRAADLVKRINTWNGVESLEPVIAELKELGIKLQHPLAGKIETSNEFMVLNFEMVTPEPSKDNNLYHTTLTSDKLQELYEDYVRLERDAWAHGIRMLRFLRKRGFDLEPGLQNLEDVKKIVHGALSTYQMDIDMKVIANPKVKKFTRHNKGTISVEE